MTSRLNADSYDPLIETVDVLSNPADIGPLKAAFAELEAGEVSSAADVRADLVARGRIAGKSDVAWQ